MPMPEEVEANAEEIAELKAKIERLTPEQRAEVESVMRETAALMESTKSSLLLMAKLFREGDADAVARELIRIEELMEDFGEDLEAHVDRAADVLEPSAKA